MGTTAKKSKAKVDTKSIRKGMTEWLVKEQTARLIKYAKEEIVEMANTHAFKNRTYNLEDSFVWSVFYNGKSEGCGYYGAKQAKTNSLFHGRKIDGRKLATAFVKGYKPATKGWEIVWAASAPYASVLEHGVRERVFEVISQRYDHIKAKLSPQCQVTLTI